MWWLKGFITIFYCWHFSKKGNIKVKSESKSVKPFLSLFHSSTSCQFSLTLSHTHRIVRVWQCLPLTLTDFIWLIARVKEREKSGEGEGWRCLMDYYTLRLYFSCTEIFLSLFGTFFHKEHFSNQCIHRTLQSTVVRCQDLHMFKNYKD